MPIPNHIFALTFGLIALSAPDASAAGKVPSGPTPWLKTMVGRAQKLAEERVKPHTKEAEAWEKRATATIGGMIHWQEMTERSLGRQWTKLDKKQQKEFRAFLRKMVEASYRSKLRLSLQKPNKRPKKVHIDWLSEDLSPPRATVEAKLQSNKTQVLLEFRTLYQKKEWRIYDVLIDEVSTVRTYRSQFRKIIAKEGFDALLDRIKRKTREIDKESQATSRTSAAPKHKRP